MNLIAYSDSESDGEAPAAAPAPKPAPKAFQKVVDRSNPGRIKLNLPGASAAATGSASSPQVQASSGRLEGPQPTAFAHGAASGKVKTGVKRKRSDVASDVAEEQKSTKRTGRKEVDENNIVTSSRTRKKSFKLLN